MAIFYKSDSVIGNPYYEPIVYLPLGISGLHELTADCYVDVSVLQLIFQDSMGYVASGSTLAEKYDHLLDFLVLNFLGGEIPETFPKPVWYLCNTNCDRAWYGDASYCCEGAPQGYFYCDVRKGYYQKIMSGDFPISIDLYPHTIIYNYVRVARFLNGSHGCRVSESGAIDYNSQRIEISGPLSGYFRLHSFINGYYSILGTRLLFGATQNDHYHFEQYLYILDLILKKSITGSTTQEKIDNTVVFLNQLLGTNHV